jgi:hypothetical protein
MAIAHDANTMINPWTTGTKNTTHTPGGVPRGVVVILIQNVSTTDRISGVTYGGVAMTRVLKSDLATGETGSIYVYFLGAGIPTGAVTVASTATSGGVTTAGVVSTVTAAADTEVEVSNSAAPGVGANPSLSLAVGAGVAAACYYGLFSGLDSVGSTVSSGATQQFTTDFGDTTGYWARKLTTGSTTIGYTMSSDDVNHAGVAIKEVAPPGGKVKTAAGATKPTKIFPGGVAKPVKFKDGSNNWVLA